MPSARHALPTRRTGLAAALVALALAVPAPAAGIPARPSADAAGAPSAYDPNAVNVGWSKVAMGLSRPVRVTHAGDGSGRLFIAEQGGRIRVVTNTGALLATPFLDLTANVASDGERGLLGLAFHPRYETNGKFYVYFTLKGSNAQVVNEYRASPPSANTVDWHTGRRLLTMSDPYSNHNGGNMAFGPNEYLYIGTGDGGSAGDPGNRAQSLNTLLGKMLRIDVSGTAGGKQYRIPPTNPYAGAVAGLDEIFARGLRNPWVFSFDRAQNDLWIGDVGQNLYEEVNVSRASAGGGLAANYGWKVMEGRHCFSPSTGCNTSGKVVPIVEYGHTSGNCSVTGGYVYRGTNVLLQGGYFFGDYCSGRLWSISAAAASPATKVQHLQSSYSISGFGQGEDGEVYIIFHEGLVYRITGTPK